MCGGEVCGGDAAKCDAETPDTDTASWRGGDDASPVLAPFPSARDCVRGDIRSDMDSGGAGVIGCVIDGVADFAAGVATSRAE